MRTHLALGFFGLLLTACSAPTAQILDIHSVESGTVTLPKAIQLSVPFTVQAPHANWDDPYQEACEEASLLILHSYLAEQELSPESANEALLSLITWEEEQGYPQDVTIEELASIAKQYYGYQTEILDNPDIEAIEMQIAMGNPVIVPAAGRMLGNPYFSGEGPWYHMLVITGYDTKRFTTNDPGTRRGESYEYRKEILMESIHDWNGTKEQITSGKKRVLIVRKQETDR